MVFKTKSREIIEAGYGHIEIHKYIFRVTEYLMEENIWAQKNLGTIISLEVRGEVQGKTRYYISDEKEESA